MRLVLATANSHKALEISAVLGSVPGLSLLPRPPWVPEVEESGSTLEDNARLKAEALALATGEAAVADDTGLEVSALGGAPGVYSARYAGEGATYADNVAKLLAALAAAAGPGSAGPPRRGARFRTVALVAWPDGREVLAEGAVDGEIAEVPRGGGGFGYDSVFVPAGGDGRTFAEMSLEEKEAVSHRGRAFRALAGLLASAPRAAGGV